MKEANAIGTTWLRAALLPDAHRQPVRALLRDYVDVRLRAREELRDPALLTQRLRQNEEIQSKLWQHAEDAAREAPNDITATFVESLNETIDTDGERDRGIAKPYPDRGLVDPPGRRRRRLLDEHIRGRFRRGSLALHEPAASTAHQRGDPVDLRLDQRTSGDHPRQSTAAHRSSAVNRSRLLVRPVTRPAVTHGAHLPPACPAKKDIVVPAASSVMLLSRGITLLP